MTGTKCHIPHPRFDSCMSCTKAKYVVWQISKGSRLKEWT